MRPTTRLPWVGKGSEALNEGIYHHWQYRTQVFLSPRGVVLALEGKWKGPRDRV